MVAGLLKIRWKFGSCVGLRTKRRREHGIRKVVKTILGNHSDKLSGFEGWRKHRLTGGHGVGIVDIRDKHGKIGPWHDGDTNDSMMEMTRNQHPFQSMSDLVSKFSRLSAPYNLTHNATSD
ncbi:hypothetical protein LTR10_011865 [Elasticomyces elasticus]|nr:hypothetical protein LTR10_011865 [Elasticomyces elasticus]KAK4968809.1 hypothetical protein LTR42_009086 [Elasticomyces elasticus]